MNPQHPATPETETGANGKVELTYDERTTLAVAIHDLPANPCQCTHVYAAVERIVAERVRVVEGERDAAKAEAWDEGAYVGRAHQMELQRHAHWSHIGKALPEAVPNPYRAARKGGDS